jgi:hypothetical protein
MHDYKLAYVLKHDNLVDLKICFGVILLLFLPEDKNIPLTICDVHSGQEIAKMTCKREQTQNEQL